MVACETFYLRIDFDGLAWPKFDRNIVVAPADFPSDFSAPQNYLANGKNETQINSVDLEDENVHLSSVSARTYAMYNSCLFSHSHPNTFDYFQRKVKCRADVRLC